MLKKDLENKIIELNSKIFDLESKLFEAETFGQIGDEKLIKAYKKVDELLVKIKKYEN